MNFRPLSKIFMIADSGVFPLNCLCCSVYFIVNWGSISRDIPQDVSILTAAFISLLVFAVAISVISMSSLVFTLIRRLHHKLREACIEWEKLTLNLRNLLLKLSQPNLSSVYYINDPLLLKFLMMMILGHVNVHLSRCHFQNCLNPVSTCSPEMKSTNH